MDNQTIRKARERLNERGSETLHQELRGLYGEVARCKAAGRTVARLHLQVLEFLCRRLRIERAYLEACESAPLMDPGRPLAEDAVGVLAFILSQQGACTQQGLPDDFVLDDSSSIDDWTTAAWSCVRLWTYVRACRRSAPNIVRVDRQTLDALANTDITGLAVDCLHAPFDAFYFQLPRDSGLALIDDSGSRHPVELVHVAESHDTAVGSIKRTLLFVLQGTYSAGSHSGFNDVLVYVSVPIGVVGSLKDLAAAMAEVTARRHAAEGTPVPPRDLAFLHGRALANADLQALCVNLLLYTTAHQERITAASGSGLTLQDWMDAPAHTRRPVFRNNAHNVWQVPGVELDPVLTEPLFKYPTLVRGHWRRQVHGPGRRMRKLIWVRPFVRNQRAEATVAGGDYSA